MRVSFVTLFPEIVAPMAEHSILRRAQSAGLVEFAFANPRDFATDARRTVDDRPFGGGPGMVMMAPVLEAAFRSLSPAADSAVVVPDPTGPLFTQADALELASQPEIVFVCGHYEGIDERFAQARATHRFSIGDFVLTGGEIPAMAIADAVVRLIPGVLGDPGSLAIDCHADGLLSAPQYTKPELWEGVPVPDVLRSGNHGDIAAWKRRQSLATTRRYRPDLLARAHLETGDSDVLSS